MIKQEFLLRYVLAEVTAATDALRRPTPLKAIERGLTYWDAVHDALNEEDEPDSEPLPKSSPTPRVQNATFTIRLPVAQRSEIERSARAKGVSVSSVVRERLGEGRAK